MADELTPYDGLLARVAWLETQIEVIHQALANLQAASIPFTRREIETWDAYKARIGSVR